jgi:hypothetical protein
VGGKEPTTIKITNDGNSDVVIGGIDLNAQGLEGLTLDDLSW